MILQALHQLSIDDALVSDIDYFWRYVSWFIDIREDGSLVGITDNRVNVNEGKTGKNGKPLPAYLRAKGAAPRLGLLLLCMAACNGGDPSPHVAEAAPWFEEVAS